MTRKFVKHSEFLFGNVMVILMIGFQILRFFCVPYGICGGRDFILQVHLI